MVSWSSSLEYNKTPISSCSLISNGMVAEYATIATVHSDGSIDSYRCYHSFIHQTVAESATLVAATVATIEFQSRHPVFYNQATTFRRWGSCYRCYHATIH